MIFFGFRKGQQFNINTDQPTNQDQPTIKTNHMNEFVKEVLYLNFI